MADVEASCHAAVVRSAAVVPVTVVALTANSELSKVSRFARSVPIQPCTYELATHPLLDSQRHTNGHSEADVEEER